MLSKKEVCMRIASWKVGFVSVVVAGTMLSVGWSGTAGASTVAQWTTRHQKSVSAVVAAGIKFGEHPSETTCRALDKAVRRAKGESMPSEDKAEWHAALVDIGKGSSACAKDDVSKAVDKELGDGAGALAKFIVYLADHRSKVGSRLLQELVKATSKTSTATTPPTTSAPTTTRPTTPTTTRPTTPTTTLTSQAKEAVAEARQYLSTEGFSMQALITQLDSPDGGQFSVADATAAVDSLTTVNWTDEAVREAKSYLSTEPFSCTALITQLDSPDGGQFSVAQATYGATQAGAC